MTGARQDAVVVGAGIIGLCTALELADAGLSVTVVSRDQPGEGASAGNAGMLVPSHVVPLAAPGVIAQGLRWMLRRDAPFHIRVRADLDFARWLLRFRASCTEEHVRRAVPILRDLGLAGMACYDDLAAEADDFALANTGLMMVFRTDRAARAMYHEADISEEAGFRVRRLDRDALAQTEPNLLSAASGAILFEQDGRVDPDRLLASLHRRLVARGVSLRFGETVTAVRSGSVDVGSERIEADAVVIATGAWAGRLAKDVGARLPVQPAKGYSVTVPAPERGPTIPMILVEDRVAVTPMPGRLRFGGTLSLSGFDPRVDPLRVRPILDQVALYRPDAVAPPVWYGFRPASPDGLPILGRIAPGVWAATGHGMMGISFGPVSGRLVADLVVGRDPVVDPAPFDPARFA